MGAQVVLRHGQLRMYSNREVVRSGKDGRGLFVVINGLVRIGYQDPLGNTQEYFLGTGASSLRPCPSCHILDPSLPVRAIAWAIWAVWAGARDAGLHAPRPSCITAQGVLAGGMSGLYHALTGEHLPGGRLEGTAEGNALGKGPVVFEVHQSAIEIIRKLAAREPPAYP